MAEGLYRLGAPAVFAMSPRDTTEAAVGASASPEATKPAISFVTGLGERDTHALTIDGKPNPHRSVGTPFNVITTGEIVRMVCNPPSVAKEDARWLISSTYCEHDARTHDVQRERGEFWHEDCRRPFDVERWCRTCHRRHHVAARRAAR